MKNSKRILFYLLFAITISLNLPKNVFAVELLTNGGFETGTLAGWTVANTLCPDNGTSFFPWAARGAGVSFSGFGSPTSPLFGSFEASNGWACGPTLATGVYYVPEATFTLYQDVTVPAGNSVTAKFSEKLYSQLNFFGAGDWRSQRPQFYRVQIRNTSNTILQTLFTTTAPGSTITNIPWTSHTINLGATYAGQTIRLAFVFSVATGLAGPGVAEIDGVSLNAFVPTAADASVTGRVTTVEGRGISRARLTITDSQSGEIKYASTNQFGYYNFNGLESGHFYILNVQSKSYVFNPDTQSFQLNENLEGVNFVGTLPDSR
jgi:Carboxypeptidase regulatory-like domain